MLAGVQLSALACGLGRDDIAQFGVWPPMGVEQYLLEEAKQSKDGGAAAALEQRRRELFGKCAQWMNELELMSGSLWFVICVSGY
jgi:hypothetical protein